MFRVRIAILDSDEEVIQNHFRAVFERMSKLVHLTELDICAVYGYRQGLDPRLESGQGHLSVLKKLTLLHFRNTDQKMSAEDVAWMRSTWKRLDFVFGQCNEHGQFGQQPK